MKTMNNPLVSVVIPTKNRSKFVLKAIESVMVQTYKNFEIIVVDDGSDIPLAPLLLEKFGNKIICIRNDKSCGAPVARNIGSKVAMGEFIAFLDDDDFWTENKLKMQVLKLMNNKSTGLVYSGFSYVYDDSTLFTSSPLLKGDFSGQLLEKNFIGSASIPLLRKKLYIECGGFDPSFVSCQDWELWIRIASKAGLDFVDDCLVFRSVHGDQITSNCFKKIEGREQLIEKHRELFLRHPFQLSKQYQRLGTLKLITNMPRSARKHFSESLKLYKLSIVSFLGFILSFLPHWCYGKILSRLAISRLGNITFYH